jgi:hypothetical protein
LANPAAPADTVSNLPDFLLAPVITVPSAPAMFTSLSGVRKNFYIFL